MPLSFALVVINLALAHHYAPSLARFLSDAERAGDDTLGVVAGFILTGPLPSLGVIVWYRAARRLGETSWRVS